MSATRSQRYYYDTVVFEVEGTLYRVYKHAFVQWSQSVFRDMFSLPQGSGGSREGDTDENPIKLAGCTKGEFQSLLDVFYPADSLGLPKHSKEQWIAVLKLARLWDMPNIAVVAVERLDKMSLNPVEKVHLGKAHGVPTWLQTGYMALMGDLSKLTLDDMASLGWETTCRILSAHNRFKHNRFKQSLKLPESISVKWDDVRCFRCAKKSHFETLKNDTRQCRRCGLAPGSESGWGAFITHSAMQPPASASPLEDEGLHVKKEILREMFGDEIDVAESRNGTYFSIAPVDRESDEGI